MLKFHPFTTKHLKQAAKVYTACFNAAPWHEGWTSENSLNRLTVLLEIPSSIGIVATQDKQLIGLSIGHCELWTDQAHFYLNELCVNPTDQRKEIGKKLLDELMTELRNRKIVSVFLLTEHASGAESFFLAQEFETDSSTVKLWRDT